MFLNMSSDIFPIYGTKVLLIFDIAKFICFFSQKSLFACIYQKNVVPLHAKMFIGLSLFIYL